MTFRAGGPLQRIRDCLRNKKLEALKKRKLEQAKVNNYLLTQTIGIRQQITEALYKRDGKTGLF